MTPQPGLLANIPSPSILPPWASRARMLVWSIRSLPGLLTPPCMNMRVPVAMDTQENSHCAVPASCPAGGVSEPRFWRTSQNLSSGNRRWTERDHAKDRRITWALVSTGIWFSGPRGLRWSETGRVWANLKGLYTFLMSFDFKDYGKPGKVLVGSYYVLTIYLLDTSSQSYSRVLRRVGDRLWLVPNHVPLFHSHCGSKYGLYSFNAENSEWRKLQSVQRSE